MLTGGLAGCSETPLLPPLHRRFSPGAGRRGRRGAAFQNQQHFPQLCRVRILESARMYKLKRRFSSKRRLDSTSSSTAGSVSDLEDRVIMLCEDVPNEDSFDSGLSSRSLGARSGRGSQSEEPESGSEPRLVRLSRDRRACYAQKDPWRDYYVQRVVQVYESLKHGGGRTVLSSCNVALCISGHEMHLDPPSAGRGSELVAACY